MKEFTIKWNSGYMTLNLPYLFERKNGKFVHTTKSNVKKILALACVWCSDDSLDELSLWLHNNDCSDVADILEAKRR